MLTGFFQKKIVLMNNFLPYVLLNINFMNPLTLRYPVLELSKVTKKKKIQTLVQDTDMFILSYPIFPLKERL